MVITLGILLMGTFSYASENVIDTHKMENAAIQAYSRRTFGPNLTSYTITYEPANLAYIFNATFDAPFGDGTFANDRISILAQCTFTPGTRAGNQVRFYINLYCNGVAPGIARYFGEYYRGNDDTDPYTVMFLNGANTLTVNTIFSVTTTTVYPGRQNVNF